MSVADSFLEAILAHSFSRSGSGWYNINCPACGDTRKRGGLSLTASGGFRYSCFNGGCEFQEKPTGWEPGNGLGGRPRRLYTLLGGDVRDLPLKDLFRSSDVKQVKDSYQPIPTFSEIDLPEWCQSILELDLDNMSSGLTSVIEHLAERGEDFIFRHEFMWTEKHPYWLIIPCYHYGRVVGWIARETRPGRTKYHVKLQKGYIFRQDRIERGSDRRVIVVQGSTDAIALGGTTVAICRASPTDQQADFLDLCGVEIVVVPDLALKDGMGMVNVAEDRGWMISIPDWDDGVKDASKAVARYGELYAIESISLGATRNYTKARTAIMLAGNE